MTISSNVAVGGVTGSGGTGGQGTGGAGGNGLLGLNFGDTGGDGGDGGGGVGGNGGFSGGAGLGEGGGIFNDTGGTVTFRAQTTGQAARAQHVHRQPGDRRSPAAWAAPAAAAPAAWAAPAVPAVSAAWADRPPAASAAKAATANQGEGGGLFNAGTVSFTGVTVNFSHNQAQSGIGGVGGAGGSGSGGTGGTGNGGERQRRQRHRRHRRRPAARRATGIGGGIFNAVTGPSPSTPAWGEEGLQAGQGHRRHHG